MPETTLSIVLVTQHGAALARRLAETLTDGANIFLPADAPPVTCDAVTMERYAMPAARQVGRLLGEATPLLILGPIGEAVALMGPYLSRLTSLPPVVALDLDGRFVVPLVDGTAGQADTLAARIAAHIGAIPVISRSLVVGIGAEKGVPSEDFEAAVADVLHGFGLTHESVKAVATLDRRAAEEGFAHWVRQHGWTVLAYTAEQLASIQEIPNPSAVVAQAVGTPGVCEPAAMLASGSRTLLVPKQKHGRVTVSIAHLTASRSLPDREASPEVHAQGRLSIVGIGPGAPDLLTVRAVHVIETADDLVGYSGYLELLGDRVAGKAVHGSTIGREIDRVRQAIDLAHRGRRVALISSGDAGVYGMAGLVFEELQAQGRMHDASLPIEVVPGITAAQAAASLLGAPLANDFAVLSLSDLLRSRQTIERRLQTLAATDVVLALYNPQSQARRELFQRACEILLQHRHAATPVAVVKAAYRDGQDIQLSDLSHLADLRVDMESIVLVGNSQTGVEAGQMVTARGQGGFGAVARTPQPHPHEASAVHSAAAAASAPVLFVGAGPGDAELLTLKGAKALAAADVVVYAGSLVPRGVLTHVRPGTRMHNSATLTLEETHRLLSEGYRAGQRAVRLHSGDPSLYGAITEQMTLLDAEDIPYEIIPGVSAFQAVAARLGIEYTQPGVVQTVILTRPGGRTGVPNNESLTALAQHGVTLCVFLGARHVAEIQAALLSSYPATTPVAVAYRATWPDEELTVGTLADLVEMVQGPEYDRTTLIIVGPSLQRQGKRSHLYDPSYQHLFRPGKRRSSGTGSESPA